MEKKPFLIKSWHSPRETQDKLEEAGFHEEDTISFEYALSHAIPAIFASGLNIMVKHGNSDYDVLWIDTGRFGQK